MPEAEDDNHRNRELLNNDIVERRLEHRIRLEHINDKLRKNVVCFELGVQMAGHIPSPLPVKWKSSISAVR